MTYFRDPTERGAVIDVLRDHPIGVAVVGMVVAGGIAAGTAAIGGLPTAYAIVVGLAVATPPLNLGRGGASFDREGYLTEDNRTKVLVDSVVAALVALVVGAIAVFVAVTLGLRSRPLLVALAAGMTALAGQVAFFFRTVDYREIERDAE